MKKVRIFGSLLAVLLVSCSAWADSQKNSSPEANATAVQATTVNVNTPAPQMQNNLTNLSTSNTQVGVGITNSPTNSVGINNSPTNNNASVDQSGNSVLILDQSQTGNEYQNRQHIGAPGVVSAPAAQMFDPWEQSSWNISPITGGAFEKGTVKAKIDFVKYQERILLHLPPTFNIALRGNLYDPVNKKPFYVPAAGNKVGTLAVVVDENTTVDDALLYAVSLGMAKGADQMEIVQYGGRKKPTVRGSSIGFGSGASGLMGNTEAIAVAAGGGTNYSTSSIVKEEEPFLSVVYWKNGTAPKASIEVVPLKEGPTSRVIDKKKAISNYKKNN